MAQIPTKEVRDGNLNGRRVWICHYHQPDIHKKPLRNVPPTLCVVRDNENLPPKKKVYYSASHFAAIGKNGEPTSKIFSPVDNTGFRSRIGNELFVFDYELECLDEWRNQIDECVGRIDEEIKTAVKRLEDMKVKLLEQRQS